MNIEKFASQEPEFLFEGERLRMDKNGFVSISELVPVLKRQAKSLVEFLDESEESPSQGIAEGLNIERVVVGNYQGYIHKDSIQKFVDRVRDYYENSESEYRR